MKTFVTEFRTTIISMIFFTLLCGLAYPLAMSGVAQAVMPGKANGSIIDVNGQAVGSGLIGQNFRDVKYFHPRPSVAGEDGYDASASSGSNLGPSSQALVDAVTERTKAIREDNGLASDAAVPVDAVTASASGLDPHISPGYADLQVPRVAKARGMTEDQVRGLVQDATNKPTLGLMGDQRVNVLKLNVALDAAGGAR